ncbi:MAG: hypothetical protein BroJett004_07990 [Planctomycetota bacterium]|nr:MAG: hypothetical protein BroJett004_07990 [Planctomycetota bacterium]
MAQRQDIAARIGLAEQEALVQRALNAYAASERDGKRSIVWKELGHVLCHKAARLATMEHQTVAQIAAALKREDGAAVNVRSLTRWVSRVRDHYRRVCDAHARDNAAGEAIAKAQGDLPVQAALLWGLLLGRVAGSISTLDWDDLDAKSRHVTLRLMESATDAAKVFAEARRTEAQTEKLLRAIAAAAQDGSKKGPKAAAESLRTVAALVDAAMGLGGTPTGQIANGQMANENAEGADSRAEGAEKKKGSRDRGIKGTGRRGAVKGRRR